MELNKIEFISARTSLRQIAAYTREEKAKELQNGSQLLHAIKSGSLQRVKELLKLGAPVHAIDHVGDGPLHLAVIYGENTECLRELIKYGAYVGATDFAGDTPLHIVIENEKKVDFVTELLEHGAPVNATNHFGDSPLHVGVENLEGVKVLLKYGADVRALNNFGDSPLHHAVATGDKVKCVEILLKHGADPSAVNHLKETPLHMLLSDTDPKLIEHLLVHGANIHMKNSIGRTPLGIAMDRAQPLAKLLVKYTLLYTFDGNSRNLFNLNVYNDSESYDSVARYFEECVLELSKMRKVKIRNRLTLHAFATTKNSNIALFHRNKSIQDVIQKERLLAKYPIYGDFIYPKVNCALERGILLDKLKEVFLSNRINQGLVNSFGEQGILNYDCTYVISKFLSNDELSNFVSALGQFE